MDEKNQNQKQDTSASLDSAANTNQPTNTLASPSEQTEVNPPTPQEDAPAPLQPPPYPPKPAPVPPIPTNATQVVSKKVDQGGGLKKFLLVFILIGVLVAGGGYGLWWWMNRPTETAAEVTINYWGLWESEAVLKPIFDQYMKANPHVKINYVNSSPQEYRQRLVNRLSNENPEVDMFRFHNTWVPMLKPYLSSMPDWVFSNQEFNQTFYAVAQKDLKMGASYVGIPLVIDGLGLFYNEDLLIAARQEPPTTWTDVRKVAQAIKVTNNRGELEIAGIAMGETNNVDHWPDIVAALMYQGGANPAKPNTQAGREALTFYTLFTKVDKVWTRYLPNSTTYFATGNLGMYIGPAWRIYDINKISEENKVNLRFKVIPLPQLPNTNITWATYWAEGISNKSDPDVQTAAWNLLAYLSKKETLEQIYQIQTQERGIGLPYSRVDMAEQLKTHPQLGAYILQAPAARSWYLSSDTTDINGINDRIIKNYKNLVNSALDKGVSEKNLENAQQAINKILKEYGL